MKKMKLTLLSIPLAIALLLSSCSKEGASNFKESLSVDLKTEAVSTDLLSKVSKWIDQQKETNFKSREDRVEQLKLNLNLGSAYLEGDEMKRKFLVVPINSGFKSVNNKPKGPKNYMVLELNGNNEIAKGNIIQYMPATNEKIAAPKGVFANIFNYKEVNCDARFAVLTIGDIFSYDLLFEKGKLQSVRVPQKKVTSGSTLSGCTDWYLITTVYYTDGSSDSYESYLGRTCDAGPGEWQDMQPDPNGGGGDVISYIYEVSKPKTWVVAEPINHYWYVKAEEILKGNKDASLPGGGTITGITHNGDQIVNVVSANYASWARLGAPTLNYSSSHASCTMSGTVSFSNGQGDVAVPTQTNMWYPSDL